MVQDACAVRRARSAHEIRTDAQRVDALVVDRRGALVHLALVYAVAVVMAVAVCVRLRI